MENKLFLTIRRIRHRRRSRYAAPPAARRHLCYNPLYVTLLLAFVIAAYFIGLLELRLRPVAEEMAARQVNNRVTAQLYAALSDIGTDYYGLLDIQRAQDGSIIAVTGNMEKINELRASVVSAVLDTISAVDVHTLGIPLGSLFDFDLLWAKGPVVEVHSLVVGVVSTQIRSEFQTAGINQTLHRILLDVNVPLTVLLPGSQGETTVSVPVCVAETVIVGQVPQIYLNMAGGEVYERGTGSASAAAGAGAGGL